MGILVRRKDQSIAIIAVVGTLVAVAAFLNQEAVNLGLDAAMGQNIVSVLPGLFITFIGLLFAFRVVGSPACVAAFTLAGVGVAVLLEEMEAAGIIADNLLGNASVTQFQVIVVIIFTLIGILLYTRR